MLKQYLIYAPGAIQFMVLCALTSVCYLLGNLFSSLLQSYFLNISAEDFISLKVIPASMGESIKWINSFLGVVSLLVPALLFSYLSHPKPLEFLTWKSPIKNYHLFWGITLMAIALPFSSLLEQWTQLIPSIATPANKIDQYNKMTNAMLAGKSVRDLIANIVAISLLPALIEELLFRACLQNVMVKWLQKTPFTAILFVAILFSAFHGQMSGFFPRLFLGLMLGFAYYFSGSIWVSILMHALNNFIVVVLNWLNT
jgi:uncharacterized protein